MITRDEVVRLHRQQLQQARAERKRRMRLLLHALAEDAADEMYGVWTADDYSGFWRLAIGCMSRRDAPPVSQTVRDTFVAAWIETAHTALSVGAPQRLVRALRRLMPAYHGPAVTLYRGTLRLRWQGEAHAQHGMSWSGTIAGARPFAENYRDEGCIVRIEAQPAAIICKIEYPPPVTAEELEAVGLPPDTKLDDYSAEDEYLVDPAMITEYEILAL